MSLRPALFYRRAIEQRVHPSFASDVNEVNSVGRIEGVVARPVDKKEGMEIQIFDGAVTRKRSACSPH